MKTNVYECKICNEFKPIDQFYLNPYLPCKKCKNVVSKAWRDKNKDKHRGYCLGAQTKAKSKRKAEPPRLRIWVDFKERHGTWYCVTLKDDQPRSANAIEFISAKPCTLTPQQIIDMISNEE